MKTILLLVVLSVLGSAIMLSLQAPKLEQTLDGLNAMKKGKGGLPGALANQKAQSEMSDCVAKCRQLDNEESDEDQMACQRKCVSSLAEQIGGIDKMMGSPTAPAPPATPRARAIPLQ